MRFFLKTHTQSVVEKLIPNLFLKIQIEHIFGSTFWNFIQLVLIACLSRGLPKYIKTKVLTIRFYVIGSFSKSKKKSGTNLPAYILHDFWRKIFSPVFLTPTRKLYNRFHVGKNGIRVGSFQKTVFFQIFN